MPNELNHLRPPEGPGGDSTWNLTLRDRHANNIAASIGATHPDPELGYELDEIEIPPYSPGCPADSPTHGPALPEGEHPDPFVISNEFHDVLDTKYRKVLHTPWYDVKQEGG